MAAASCSIPPDSPQTRKSTLLKLELLLCYTALLLILLLLVGSMRRRHRNALLRPITSMVYTLSYVLMVSAIALMQNAPFCDEMFPLWAAFLVMVQFGGVDTFAAFSPKENEEWRSFFVQYLSQSFVLCLLVALDAVTAKSVIFVTSCIVLLVGIKFIERAVSLRSASESVLQEKFKVIADYMSTEHLDSGTDEVDPVSMRGYRYVVKGEEVRRRSNEVNAPEYFTPLLVTDELITVEKVWNCSGWLLSTTGGDPHGHLKDICLSFSLFKLLILKIADYPMPREAYQKTWRLIEYGLLSSNDGNRHERVFRVIERELAFLFGLFYTTYPIIVHPLLWAAKLFRLVIMPVVSGATAMLLFTKYSQVEDPNIVLPESSQVLVTVMVMVIYTVVEFLQLMLAYTSEWAQVMLLCNYVKRETWRGRKYFEKLLKAICSTHFSQWDRKLGQCSLVRGVSHCQREIRQVAPTRLTEQMKKGIMRSLITNGSGQLRNGLSSLRHNGVMDQLSWACHLETQTQVIMVWHIATFFCEHEVPSLSHVPEQMENFDIATKLSKYLAYLAAFAPRMLPDHPHDTQHVFHQVVIESKRFFKGCKNIEQRIQKLRAHGDPGDKTVLGRAVQLGEQLVNEIRDPESNQVGDRGFIWRILAEFWAELVLYVAPSDDVKVHLSHLTLGGEFVTHLWALLHHAGIERAPPPSRSPGEDEGTQRAAPPSPPPTEDEGIQRAPPPGEDEDEDGV